MRVKTRRKKMNILFLGIPGGYEWFVILLVALLLFGKRLPEVARSMGQSITEFKKGIKGADPDNEIKNAIDEVKEEVNGSTRT